MLIFNFSKCIHFSRSYVLRFISWKMIWNKNEKFDLRYLGNNLTGSILVLYNHSKPDRWIQYGACFTLPEWKSNAAPTPNMIRPWPQFLVKSGYFSRKSCMKASCFGVLNPTQKKWGRFSCNSLCKSCSSSFVKALKGGHFVPITLKFLKRSVSFSFKSSATPSAPPKK